MKLKLLRLEIRKNLPSKRLYRLIKIRTIVNFGRMSRRKLINV